MSLFLCPIPQRILLTAEPIWFFLECNFSQERFILRRVPPSYQGKSPRTLIKNFLKLKKLKMGGGRLASLFKSAPNDLQGRIHQYSYDKKYSLLFADEKRAAVRFHTAPIEAEVADINLMGDATRALSCYRDTRPRVCSQAQLVHFSCLKFLGMEIRQIFGPVSDSYKNPP